MYSVIINWEPGVEMPEGAAQNRYAAIPDYDRAARFKQFVDAGLVSNSAGPNCYFKTVDGAVEFCNSTWQTLEAAQEWADMSKILSHVVRIRILDQSGNILFSHPE